MKVETRDVVREAYSHGGEDYDDLRLAQPRGLLLSRHDQGIFRRLLPEFREGMQVLEVGAGTGRFTLEALQRGYHLIASDVNEEMRRSLQAKVTELDAGDRCRVVEEDIFQLSFPDDHFDLVFSLHVIPRFLTVEDQRCALRELARVVRPGGRLLFNYRNAHSPYNLLYSGPAIKPGVVEEVLRQGGLRIHLRRVKHVLNRRLLNVVPLALGRALSAVDRGLERVWLGVAWDVFVLASKEPPKDPSGV